MSGHKRALVIFARAPELGRVKTRMAADLGAPAALSVYRRLAEHVVAAVEGGARYSVMVAHTPPGAEWEMRGGSGRRCRSLRRPRAISAIACDVRSPMRWLRAPNASW